MFDSFIYPGVFMGASVVGLALFFWGKCKEVSLVYTDFIAVRRGVMRFFGLVIEDEGTGS